MEDTGFEGQRELEEEHREMAFSTITIVAGILFVCLLVVSFSVIGYTLHRFDQKVAADRVVAHSLERIADLYEGDPERVAH